MLTKTPGSVSLQIINAFWPKLPVNVAVIKLVNGPTATGGAPRTVQEFGTTVGLTVTVIVGIAEMVGITVIVAVADAVGFAGQLSFGLSTQFVPSEEQIPRQFWEVVQISLGVH